MYLYKTKRKRRIRLVLENILTLIKKC